ncbi:polyribonucleotide nucleotidyltransferase [Myxococcota bacterium]|nr:polyribonucleotide nucleotidyltransferase [Myxococcota bacterium]MCZ7618659.1 polyribonucleotide nucleotidyltransferase [Myxococcota bacterium]
MANYWFQPHSVTLDVGGRPMTLETGRMAKQASGAVVVTYGETVVLVTCTTAKAREGIDFLPLTVDFVEKTSAAGKIPGGFFKREGRLSDREVLVSRFIDRSVRPLFAEGWRDETHIVATVLSADRENTPDLPAFVGASAALHLSDAPFLGPIGAVRVGRIDGKWVINPLRSQLPEADVELVVAGSRSAVVMVEGGAKQVPEAEILEGLRFGHAELLGQLDPQEELRRVAGKAKRNPDPAPDSSALVARVRELVGDDLREAVRIEEKLSRYKAIGDTEKRTIETLSEEYRRAPAKLESLADVEERRAGLQSLVSKTKSILHDVRSDLIRERILSDAKRIDGRGTADIRPIACELRVVPRVHGVALFTRGETQSLVSATLGSAFDTQMIDGLTERYEKAFMFHYNFPPFSVGEARMLRGPGRREVGHGTLAERAIQAVLPSREEFPYTLRIVAETLESNGSSSMAAICGATLALMDGGVPIAAPVAGIAMGLIEEGDRVAILSDILGDEDHLGDMDFKVAGTRAGITAVQMDIKVRSVDWSVMERALEQARQGRLHILDRMEAETADVLGGQFSHRTELADHAPRMTQMWIKPDRIRDIIGPGGRVIRAIQEATGVKIDVEDTGQVRIFSPDGPNLERARAMVEELTQEAELGRIYAGKVKRITDFGAFVEIFPGTDGMIHISQLAEGRVERVTDVIQEGDEVLAKCIDIDPSGRIRLSRKEALADLAAEAAPPTEG